MQQDDSRICRTSFIENKSNEYFVTCNEDFSSSAPELSIRNSLNGNLRLKYITITDSEKPGCNLMVTVEQESFLYNLSCFSLDNPGNPFKGEDYGDPKEDLFK